MHSGYILQTEWEDRDSRHLIHLWGVGDVGPFHLIFTHEKPLFFVEHSADLSLLSVPQERKPLDLTNFERHPVDGLYFSCRREALKAQEDLQRLGIRTYEADVRSPERYLMERFIYGDIHWAGEGERYGHVWEFINPPVSKGQWHPRFKILSLDIETGRHGELYSLAQICRDGDHDEKRIYMVGEGEAPFPHLQFFANEKELLKKWLEEWPAFNADIVVGWNIIGFDLLILMRKCLQYDLPFSLGRQKLKADIFERRTIGWSAKIPGRVVLDVPSALRRGFYNFENYKLETVARTLLGKGKNISASGQDKIAEIERRFREDKKALAEYNLLDCQLVLEILDKTKIIDLMLTRSRLTGLTMERLDFSTQAFDYFFLPVIHRHKLVAPNIGDTGHVSGAPGGHVLNPVVGMHQHVAVFDFRSLYPSIIRTFKIDPLSRLNAHIDPLNTPVGIQFSRTVHALPEFIGQLLAKRIEAKARQDENLSQSVKILMNSMYGVMGSSGSRFYHPDLPRAITGTGQWALKQSIRLMEEGGRRVLYGDTDSLFVALLPGEEKDTHVGEKLAEEITAKLSQLINVQYGLESYLQLQFARYYRKIFFPPMRQAEAGAKKRYVGMAQYPHGEELQFVGMEFVRSDWTALAKRFQYELFRRLFYGEEIDSWLQGMVNNLKNGVYNDELVYRKKLTKRPEEYTHNTPPHVKAARMLNGEVEARKEIHYLMTHRGPIPLELNPQDIDYQHYLDKQIRPLAETVLGILGKSWDAIISGNQLSLF
jgi:DNA polymerase II